MAPKNAYSPDSLLRLFDPPEGFAGDFGWMCGYSADANFMRAAMQRFSACSNWIPQVDGRIGLIMMLDPSNPPLSPVDVPGLLHLGFRSDKQKPFALMHAKVALLGFQNLDSADWKLRLVVSTGNWTRQTVEESLDLAWTAEISSNELKEQEQEARDCLAAWEMLIWLRQYYASPFPLHESSRSALSENHLALRRFEERMGAVRKVLPRKSTLRPHFIDSRESSFMKKLKEQIEYYAGTSARNYLAMGSGFFEQGDTLSPNGLPLTLDKIVTALRDEGLLTKRAKINVFVQPDNCQAVAKAQKGINDAKWTIYPAGLPDFCGQRRLHAKFLFSASKQEDSPYCLKPWVYIGSANLTQQGFDKACSKGGNLEAGVIFAPESKSLVWDEEKYAQDKPQTWVENRLPVRQKGEVKPTDPLQEGDEMELFETSFWAPPFACVSWVRENGVNAIEIPETDTETQYLVLDRAQQACAVASGARRYLWPEERMPLTVTVRWLAQGQDGQEELEARVPVMDAYGRVAAHPLRPLSLSDAWGELAEYPARNDNDDDPDSPDGKDPLGADPARGQGKEASYPIRQMMQFVENIAAKQCSLKAWDWAVWLNRLERILTQAAADTTVACFQQWGINPLSPLFHAPFRPAFAEDEQTEEGRNYVDMLHRAEEVWGVAGLDPLGGKS